MAAMLRAGQFGVCTKYTLWASDRVGVVPDWLGFVTFPGESSGCRVGMRFESHLGHVFSLFRGL